jgi:hypothetical protein
LTTVSDYFSIVYQVYVLGDIFPTSATHHSWDDLTLEELIF